jgi:hypothetical protein
MNAKLALEYFLRLNQSDSFGFVPMASGNMDEYRKDILEAIQTVAEIQKS